MDKIDKALAKLSLRELSIAEGILKKIASGDFSNLNIKKLSGEKNGEDTYKP